MAMEKGMTVWSSVLEEAFFEGVPLPEPPSIVMELKINSYSVNNI